MSMQWGEELMRQLGVDVLTVLFEKIGADQDNYPVGSKEYQDATERLERLIAVMSGRAELDKMP